METSSQTLSMVIVTPVHVGVNDVYNVNVVHSRSNCTMDLPFSEKKS